MVGDQLQEVGGLVVEQAESPEPAAVGFCRTCRHIRRPGLSDGYCGSRTDLPPAYGTDHPLRQLPADRGVSCGRWEGWR